MDFRYEATKSEVYFAFMASGDYAVGDHILDLVLLLESGIRVVYVA